MTLPALLQGSGALTRNVNTASTTTRGKAIGVGSEEPCGWQSFPSTRRLGHTAITS
jgi:hypothetical protein